MTVDMVVAGAGARGRTYADFARRHPDLVRVVGVAEPDRARREGFAADHGLADEAVMSSWQELVERPKLADLAVVSTQDRDHVDPAVALMALGYDLLLEKPIAPDLEGCERVEAAAAEHGARVHVGHVLRHTAFTSAVRDTIASGAIGQIMAVQRFEPVGHWHFAHSFVRGNWRNETLSSPILLAKSCHDIDWIAHLIGAPCRSVSSMGSLVHFRAESKPVAAGAAMRCLDCGHEPDCAWSAPALYLALAEGGWTGFPLTVLTDDVSPDSIRDALADGPYGRCVYECDNDVPDTQSVLMEFDGGAQASFTLSAFSEMRLRETRILGTEGELRGDGVSFDVHRFVTGRTERHTPNGPDASPRDLLGHGGGDDGLMHAVVADLADPDPGAARAAFAEAIHAHRIVFAAEQARLGCRVVEVEAG